MSTETCFVKLTEAEIAERSRRLAHAVAQVESLQDEKKESAKEFNKQIKELQEEISELATSIRSGQEERDAQMVLEGVRPLREAK